MNIFDYSITSHYNGIAKCCSCLWLTSNCRIVNFCRTAFCWTCKRWDWICDSEVWVFIYYTTTIDVSLFRELTVCPITSIQFHDYRLYGLVKVTALQVTEVPNVSQLLSTYFCIFSLDADFCFLRWGFSFWDWTDGCVGELVYLCNIQFESWSCLENLFNKQLVYLHQYWKDVRYELC